MKISIITPVFNEPRIRHTLESIHSQKDIPELESIVVDGGSTDETTAILNEYDDQIDILISEPDDGTYDAMNKGINRATGDVVGILNADDR
jgi:glycosyltransferase involved in cell wall biosynthesis